MGPSYPERHLDISSKLDAKKTLVSGISELVVSDL
jgi:hypothetical protein